MKKLILVLLFGLLITGCTVKYKVVGKYEDFNEVFIGSVDSDLVTGTSFIEVETVPSKMKCTGSSRIVHIPASNYIIPGNCAGQRGIAKLNCSITGPIEASFTAKSCLKGSGSGYDKEGRLFAFTFGMDDEEAQKELDILMREVKSKPELEIYEPEKVRAKKGFSTGSGFFISSDGHILTNYHVIENANTVHVLMEDQEVLARVVKADKVNDIAVIQIDSDGLITPLPFAKNTNTKVGEEVFTLGFPLIEIQGKEQKATFGRINSLSGIEDDIRLVQIDVPIQPGNSGGPLINSKGEIIGVVTATLDSIVTLYKSGVLPQNVNFAVKSDYILPTVEGLISISSDSEKKDFSHWVDEYRKSVRLIISR
jgi:S1-C subfamily serine protease